MSYSSEVIADGAVTYYRMGEASGTVMVDAIAADNGAYANSPVLGVSGFVDDADTAVSFPNSGTSSATIPSTVNPIGGGDFSIECVIQLLSLPSNTYLFELKSAADGNHCNAFFNTGSTVPRFNMLKSGGGYGTVIAATPLEVGKVHHLVFTYDSTALEMNIVIDGVAETPLSMTQLAATPSDGRLASNQYGSNRLDVTMDEVAIYTSVLGSTQILSHVSLIPNNVSASVSMSATVAAALNRNLDTAMQTTTSITSTVQASLSLATVTRLLSDTTTFSDILLKVFGRTLSDTATFSDAVSLKLHLVRLLSDTATFADVLSKRGQYAAYITDTATFSDALTRGLHLTRLLSDTATFGVGIVVDGEEFTAWVINTDSFAPTRYSNFEFESAARVSGTDYAIKADGVYSLGGDADVADTISASFKTGVSDFSDILEAYYSNYKRIPRVYMGLRANGTIVIKTITDEKIERWYNLVDTDDSFHGERIKLSRKVEGRYWQFEIANKNGADFEIASMILYPVLLSRRVR